ncbi:hypothetical protein SEA_LIBERTYBELL_57 [Streptomyces phage LibertyBell]|nr:hypothetical protein SEA_LIBERTYBELL_57 [Streptomyces phage LibertyBell]
MTENEDVAYPLLGLFVVILIMWLCGASVLFMTLVVLIFALGMILRHYTPDE